MSKFQSTISVVAALASIFGAGAAGWKLAYDSQQPAVKEESTTYQQNIDKLKEEIAGLKQQPQVVESPQPVVTPPPQLPTVVQTPTIQAPLPPVTPPPPVPQETTP